MEDALLFRRMTEEDVPTLTAIMTRAFNADSQLHLGKDGGPEGYSGGSFLRKWGLESGAASYTVLENGRVVGCVMLFLKPAEHSGILGCLFVDSDLQSQGVGWRIWQRVEAMYPDIKTWHTETPTYSHRNHGFYMNKLGFHVVHIDNPRDWRLGQFQMTKRLA